MDPLLTQAGRGINEGSEMAKILSPFFKTILNDRNERGNTNTEGVIETFRK